MEVEGPVRVEEEAAEVRSQAAGEVAEARNQGVEEGEVEGRNQGAAEEEEEVEEGRNRGVEEEEEVADRIQTQGREGEVEEEVAVAVQHHQVTVGEEAVVEEEVGVHLQRRAEVEEVEGRHSAVSSGTCTRSPQVWVPCRCSEARRT